MVISSWAIVQTVMDSKPILSVLGRHPGIRLAVVFGSVAKGSARKESDLDLAVMAEKPLSAAEKVALIEDLALVVGRPVDLVDLRKAGEPLLGQVLKHGQRILGSASDYAELVRRHIYAVEDFVPYVERMLAERRQAWIG